jgi:hypothetical protein
MPRYPEPHVDLWPLPVRLTIWAVLFTLSGIVTFHGIGWLHGAIRTAGETECPDVCERVD